MRRRSREKGAGDVGVTYLKKDSISCGCVKAVVVRGDGARNGTDDGETRLKEQDESY
jgi:hypothetical protein